MPVHTPSTGKHAHTLSLKQQLWRGEQMMRGSVTQRDAQTRTPALPPLPALPVSFSGQLLSCWWAEMRSCGRSEPHAAAEALIGARGAVFQLVYVAARALTVAHSPTICNLDIKKKKKKPREIVEIEIWFEFEKRIAAG